MSPEDLAASVRARLSRLAGNEGATTEDLLIRFGRERLLYRLAASSYCDRFILKGASLFYVWSDRPHRPTRDIDLLGSGDLAVPDADRIFRDICVVDVEPDGLIFDPATVRVDEIREEADYGGVRVKLTAYLGRARAQLQIDVGIGDAVVPAAREVDYPTVFPEFPAPRLRTYSRESVVAEKLHTIVVLGLFNSRMKDYYDLFELSRQFDFDGRLLCDAIDATFERRTTAVPSDVPAGLSHEFIDDPTKQAQLRGFLARAQLTDAQQPLEDVVTAVRSFAMPLFESVATGVHFEKRWMSGGPWRSFLTSNTAT